MCSIEVASINMPLVVIVTISIVMFVLDVTFLFRGLHHLKKTKLQKISPDLSKF